jgi:hypothetical protein
MPPLAIAAGIAAVGTIGGAIIGSSAQKKAANQAASAQQDATAAQLQLGEQSLAQQRDMFNQGLGINTQMYNSGVGLSTDMYNRSLGLNTDIYNSNAGLASQAYNASYGLLSPYAQNGVPASNALNALLGLPGSSVLPAPLHYTPIAAPAPLTAPPPVTIPPVSQTPAGGAPTTPTATAPQPSMAQIYAMQNDGIPGNYQAAMAALNRGYQ